MNKGERFTINCVLSVTAAVRIMRLCGMKNRILIIMMVTGLAGWSTSAWAQRGDKKGQQQPEVWKGFDVPPAPALTPEEALKSFKLQPGFRIEIAAADPLVHDRWR